MTPKRVDPMPFKYTAHGLKVADRLKDMGSWNAAGTGDSQIRADRKDLIQASRNLDIENWLYQGTMTRAADYILGATGFKLQAQTGIDGLDKKIEREIWAPFAERPEARGLFNWREVEDFVLREIWLAGDTLALKLGDKAGKGLAGKLQLIEAERIDSSSSTDAGGGGNRFEQGVKLDRAGRVLGFNVCDVDHRSGYIRPSTGKVYSVDQGIFVRGRFRRSSQSRGLPHMVSGMALAHRLEDILTAEAVAWQTMSRLAFAIDPTSGGKGAVQIREDKNAEAKPQVSTKDISKMVTDLGYALVIQGHDVKGINQNRPNQKISESVNLYVRLFGVPLGIPMELIMLSLSGLNYSSARAILLLAFLNFRRWQHMLTSRFHSKVYRWQIGRAIADRRLKWRPNIFNHTWNIPGWPWIDEDKEVSAWAKKIDRALATQTGALASLGMDLDQTRLERKKEILNAHETAMEIEDETDGKITSQEIWKHLAGFGEGKTEGAVRARNDAANNDTKDKDSDDDEADE